MIRLDKLKLKTSLSNVIGFDKYHQSVTLDKKINNNGVEVVNVYKINGNNNFGIRQTKIDTIKNEVVIDFSGKILLDDYTDLINANNIDKCLNTFNENSVLKLNIQGVIDDSEALNIDTTQMIYPEHTAKMCRDSLLTMQTINRCNVMGYASKRNVGLTFTSSTKKESRRLILYDKELRMLCGLKNELLFLNQCKNPSQVINKCKGSLRVEQNIRSLNSIRNRLQISDNSLQSVLTASATPNYDFLNEIKAKNQGLDFNGEQLDLFAPVGDLNTIRELIFEVGTRGVVELCNYDLNRIRAVFRQKSDSKSNRNKYIKTIQKTMEKLKTEAFSNKNKGAKSIDINNYIFELIKTA